MEKEYAPAKISLDDDGREFVLSSLKKISDYPKKINDKGPHLVNNTHFIPGTDILIGNYDFIMNNTGLDYSIRMKTEVEGLLKYLFDLKEDPVYLNDRLTPIMKDLNFLAKDTGLVQQIKSMRSSYSIRRKKHDIALSSLQHKTIVFVDEISKRYKLSDDINDWKERMEAERDSRKEKEKPVLKPAAVFVEPKTADRDNVKDLMIDLMDLGSEQDFFMGHDIIEVFHRHYNDFMSSGADDDLKRDMRGLRDDVYRAGRDYCIRRGELTDKKVRDIIDRLKAYSS